MILIADSGSTKTDWRLVHLDRPDKEVEEFSTIGFNPFYCDSQTIVSGVKSGLPSHVDPLLVQRVYFYGAGCSSAEKSNIIVYGLKNVFSKSQIEVNHDLLAAARALFHNEAGIAVIIGTGSNTCFFDGKNIVKSFPALGYILGDEGSGAYLGGKFIKTYLANELPSDIHHRFYAEYGLQKDAILDTVYCAGSPNRFLASFSRFLCRNLNHPYIYKMVYDGFCDLFDKHICKYPNYKTVKIRCVGSIAHHFEAVLQDVARSKGAEIDRVVEFPIEDLVKFHLNSEPQ